ncbi:hypothetical protein MPSEU_000632000 [Mayamaea pseudoterrestris]|nr:hypothetical protein MPSEU_000632000 [Mayamaea pseudoterrestris]
MRWSICGQHFFNRTLRSGGASAVSIRVLWGDIPVLLELAAMAYLLVDRVHIVGMMMDELFPTTTAAFLDRNSHDAGVAQQHSHIRSKHTMQWLQFAHYRGAGRAIRPLHNLSGTVIH